MAANSPGPVSSRGDDAAAQLHDFVWKEVIGGWQIVMCRRCHRHFKYRPMGHVTEYPPREGCDA